MTTVIGRSGATQLSRRSSPATSLSLLESPSFFFALGFAHFLLALAYRAAPAAAVPHAAIVFGVCSLAALRHRTYVLPLISYVAGVELIWRMNAVPIPDQAGKLLAIWTFALALLSGGRVSKRSTLLLIATSFYLPAISLSADHFGWTFALRRAVSFNLTGPVLIGLGAAVLVSLRSRPNLLHALTAFSIPVLGLGLFVAYNTATATSIRYTVESNFQTSGDFGPNQVSLVLALGFLSTMILATAVRRTSLRVLLVATAGSLIALSIFTFSRTGLFCALGGLVVLWVLLAIGRRRSLRLSFLVATLGTTILLVVLPDLNERTGGNLQLRYNEVVPGTRLELVQTDLRLFRREPLFGVGAGVSQWLRDEPRLVGHAPHTEYTRALAEHGLFGLLAMLLIYGVWTSQCVRATSAWSRAVASATGVAAILAMSATSVRLSAMSLFLLFAFAIDTERRARTR